jgi:hypothetical protein
MAQQALPVIVGVDAGTRRLEIFEQGSKRACVATRHIPEQVFGRVLSFSF